MEGKVELPIERYEELTKIERDGFAKVKELEANIDKIYVWYSDWLDKRAEYHTKDEIMNALHDKLSYVTKEWEMCISLKDKAIGEKEAVIQKYNKASFWKRFKYLWTGRM